ncbi:MAG TPA: S41 family peptidase [Thermoanaerobaculia bacterium]|jgi:carboxyl-terminal processing protease|nr:S41 family peptidase [Thermoanaerobaculia bacterium]
MRRPWRIAAAVIFVSTTLAGALFGDRLLALSDNAREGLRQYTELVEAVHDHYGTNVTYKDVVYSSIHGMLRKLDPHTSFLPPEAYARMRDRQQASFYGLGILVGMRDNKLTVISPLEGTPASRMGIRAGDIITTINGEPTDTMPLDDAVTKLKGPKDTEVTITIARRGVSTPLELTIKRAEIPLTTVRYTMMIAPGTGYFRVTEFSRSTGKEVADAIASLRAQGMQRLLLDLRNNGGGLLDQAIAVADQFVPEGSLIVETKGRIRDSFHKYKADGDHKPLDLPLVVLVNSGSASAAEILSGAIQDHDVGVIAGTPTWGKGLVQTVYTLPYDGALALTTAQYYTPSGRLIQRDYTSFYDYYAHGDGVNAEGEESSEGPIEVPRGDEPVFYTDLGRKVYGGGGISPDVLVHPQESPELLQFLEARNAFFEFGVEYTNAHKVNDPKWIPGADVLQDFERWVKAQGMVEDEKDIDKGLADEKTRHAVLSRLRAEIFNATLGNDVRYRVLAEDDNQIQQALGLFGKASDLLALRKGEKGETHVAAGSNRH